MGDEEREEEGLKMWEAKSGKNQFWLGRDKIKVAQNCLKQIWFWNF